MKGDVVIRGGYTQDVEPEGNICHSANGNNRTKCQCHSGSSPTVRKRPYGYYKIPRVVISGWVEVLFFLL